MARTTSASVQAVLKDDYDGATDLTPYIATASAIVDRVKTCATRKGKDLSDVELELVERWLAAHLYCQSDKPYTNRSTEGASGAFAGQTSMGFDSTLYGQTACRVDFSGCLLNIDKRQMARSLWLGKTATEQLTYDQRN